MLIYERVIPPFVKPFIGETQQVTTTQGTYDSNDFFTPSKSPSRNFVRLGRFPRYTYVPFQVQPHDTTSS